MSLFNYFFIFSSAIKINLTASKSSKYLIKKKVRNCMSSVTNEVLSYYKKRGVAGLGAQN